MVAGFFTGESEALKADVYLWLAKAGPFSADPDAAALRERTDRLRRDAADLEPQRAGIVLPSLRELPPVRDRPSFFAVRVESQRTDYYLARAAKIVRQLRFFRRLEMGVAGIGTLLGRGGRADRRVPRHMDHRGDDSRCRTRGAPSRPPGSSTN